MSEVRGPAFYEHLIAFQPNQPSLGAVEAPLFTDSAIIGEHSMPPYMLINPVAVDSRPGYFRPAIVLRVEAVHTDAKSMPMDKTDTSRYHGGSLIDEIAALVALSIGIRLQAGGVNREFGPDGRGRPIAAECEPWPESRMLRYRPRLPWTAGEHELSRDSLTPIEQIDRLTPVEANALIKAARNYQQALWIGEWEPSQSWLHLVSAVEAVMNFAKARDATDAELLEYYNPEIAGKIRRAGGDELVANLAPSLRLLFSSTKKFCDFVVNYFPEPPAHRPPGGFQIPWETEAIMPMLRRIYNHRSKALHEGTPFPWPMCLPPFTGNTDWEAPMELPPGKAARAQLGAWLNSDTPMHLHIFDYIVRKSICKWWTARTAAARA